MSHPGMPKGARCMAARGMPAGMAGPATEGGMAATPGTPGGVPPKPEEAGESDLPRLASGPSSSYS